VAALSIYEAGVVVRRQIIPPWFGALTDAYLRSLARRGRRPMTIETYRYELIGFGAWIQARGVRSLATISLDLVEAWQDDMEERRLKPSSRCVASYALRGLLRWASAGAADGSDPTLYRRITVPRVFETDPRPIPPRDLESILAAFSNADRDDAWWLRTKALFLVLFSSGARISEALQLDRGPISDDGMPIIQKGGRPHLLVMNDSAKLALAELEASRHDDAPAAFINHKPTFYGRRLRKGEAQKAWNKLCTELSIPRFTNHQVRHSTGTTLRRRGADVLVISRQLGHRGLKMAQRYVQIDVEDRRRAVALLDSLPMLAMSAAMTGACLAN